RAIQTRSVNRRATFGEPGNHPSSIFECLREPDERILGFVVELREGQEPKQVMSERLALAVRITVSRHCDEPCMSSGLEVRRPARRIRETRERANPARYPSGTSRPHSADSPAVLSVGRLYRAPRRGGTLRLSLGTLPQRRGEAVPAPLASHG